MKTCDEHVQNLALFLLLNLILRQYFQPSLYNIQNLNFRLSKKNKMDLNFFFYVSLRKIMHWPVKNLKFLVFKSILKIILINLMTAFVYLHFWSNLFSCKSWPILVGFCIILLKYMKKFEVYFGSGVKVALYNLMEDAATSYQQSKVLWV